MTKENNHGWQRFLLPAGATLFYLATLIIWFLGFFSLVLGIAPKDAPITFISMICYPIVLFLMLVASFVYAFRGQLAKSKRAALIPLFFGFGATTSYGLLVLSYA